MSEKELKSIDEMVKVSAGVVGTSATPSECDIAKHIAINVINGRNHRVFVENACREERKRIVGIAYNMVGSRKRFWCKNKCDACKKTCCYNLELKRRFAEEMFPGNIVY